MVATALNGTTPLGVGAGIPANAQGSQVFTADLVTTLDGAHLWNQYEGTDGNQHYWNAGPAASAEYDPVGGFLWLTAGVGSAGQVVQGATELMTLSPAGALNLLYGTLSVARDPAASHEVATLNYVSNNTVQSFNQRQGQVQLNATDVYQALRLNDPLATQPWVNQAITNSLQNFLYTCPLVNTWNGRQGQVYLMLSDITCVFYQSGQQPISPTPPITSNDDSIATTKWVSENYAPVLTEAAPPANPQSGQLWWDTSDGNLYVYYQDPTSAQWVSAMASAAADALPLTGGTMTGPLILAGDPVVPLGAATMQYVDNSVGTRLPLTGGTLRGTLTITPTMDGEQGLLINAVHTQPVTDHEYNIVTSIVEYTANATGGDSLGFISYMASRPNGNTVGTVSGHTSAIYGNAYLDNDGNAASSVAHINGVMAVTGNGGPGTLIMGVDFFGHTNYNTGGGSITNHYFLFQEPSTGATNEYGAYLSAPVGIGTNIPTYNLHINCNAGQNVLANNGLFVDFSANGSFFITRTGSSIFPGFNPGAGGFGCVDLVVGDNGQVNAPTATTGFLYLSRCAGAPTGVPTWEGIAGVPITVDTVNNRLCVYMNGAWHTAQLT